MMRVTSELQDYSVDVPEALEAQTEADAILELDKLASEVTIEEVRRAFKRQHGYDAGCTDCVNPDPMA